MRKAAVFLLAATTVILQLCSRSTIEAAQLPRTIHVQNEPGKLEVFLVSKPNVSINQRLLGALPAPKDSLARFTAIVAEDPVSKNKAKGLKVELNNGQHADSVYVDEEGLEELQRQLAAQIESQRFLQEHLDQYDLSDLEKTEVGDAVNHSPATGQWYVPLVLGFYRIGNHFGVYLETPWGIRHHTVQLWLPDANTSQLADLLAKAQTFLQAN